ncbi:MAG: LptF/LptG family permease [Alphaproteobacteria bacterium]
MFNRKIINRFLLRRFFSGVGLVLLIVCGIIFAVTFVERLQSNPDIFATLIDSWTRLLEYVPMFLPLAVFMGTLLASYNLTKSSEAIIISGAGMSPYQMARPFICGSALIGIFATAVINPYFVNLSNKNITEDNLKLVDNSIWLHETNDNGYLTMSAKTLEKQDENLIFYDVNIFNQTTNFKLSEHVQAEKITLSNNGLETENAQIWDSKGHSKTSFWSQKTQITPQTILDRYLQPDQVSFWELPSFIQKMSHIGVPVRGHLVQFWTLLFLPITMISMATLGIAFSQTRQRRNFNFGIKFGLGILTCFIVYFLTNTFNALGAIGSMPALLAIIAPPLIIISFSGIFIEHYDTI